MSTTLDSTLTKAITGCVAIGPGNFVNFYLNNKLIRDKIVWEQYCIADPYYGGIICDNKLEVRMEATDRWGADSMTTKVVVNRIDPTNISNLPALKRKTAKKNKVIHLN